LISKSSKWNQFAQPRKKCSKCKLNASGVANLVGTTSSISFTRPIAFERGHHSLFYSMFYDFPRGYIQMAFSPRTPKWKSWNWDYYCPETLDAHIFLKNIFSTVYCTPQSEIIWPLL
jgi:hypothetical protein